MNCSPGRTIKLILLIMAFSVIYQVKTSGQNHISPPTEILYPVLHDTSPPLSEMPALDNAKRINRGETEVPNQNYALFIQQRNALTESATVPDPVLQSESASFMQNSTIVNIDGIENSVMINPPDPVGDVGVNYYIQAVNINFAVYSKSGSLLYGPAALKTLWQGLGTYTSDGDPVVLYDHLADRWIISQFSLPNYPNGPFYELIAVSQTPDPLGAWYRYAFKFDNMPDYPKFGLWPDGYYMAANMYTSGTNALKGPAAIVLERDSLLVGKKGRMILFQCEKADEPLLPADFDGPAPPAGTPGYFLSTSDGAAGADDKLKLYTLHADWKNPANSALTGPTAISIATFDGNMCNGDQNCIPQAGSTRRLDPLSRYLMNRLQYRNFGTHHVLMANHTVDVDNTDHAGIRWYELRSSGTNWSVYQQGTYAPDTNHRWIGSIAMDGTGNIALAYSVSGKGMFPSIRATGRRAGDPAGQMTFQEQTIMEGGGAQNDGTYRWGDYSCLTVDPVDDNTLWYTNEYYATTSLQNWKTRIASFRINELPVGISEKPGVVANYAFGLNNYPNPFENSTIISWQLRKGSHVVLKVFDFMGREIRTLVNENQAPGSHHATFNAEALQSGVYYYQLNINGKFETKKMIILK